MWEAAELVPALVNRVDQEDAARDGLKRTEPTTVGSARVLRLLVTGAGYAPRGADRCTPRTTSGL